MNLVVNSRDALPAGGKITLEVSNCKISGNEKFLYGQETNPGEYLKLIVSDTGMGMNEDTKMKIFDPFFTTKPVGKGTGLGLSTVFGIIRQCKGIIHVESEPEKGTKFSIYLPKTTGDVTAEKDQDSSSGSHKIQNKSRKVLYVEDEEVLREIVCDGLKSHGYDVIAAPSGKKALEIINSKSHNFDLLIVDVVMPEMDGAELAKKVREDSPNMKILFLSGYLGDTLQDRGIDWTSSGFLEKPFTSKTLLQKLDTLFQV